MSENQVITPEQLEEYMQGLYAKSKVAQKKFEREFTTNRRVDEVLRAIGIDMTMLEAFVKERNEALFSLDRKKIEAYMIKYGETEIAQTPDVVFWASVYKAICGVKDALEAIVSKAKAWLHEHGMSPNLAG